MISFLMTYGPILAVIVGAIGAGGVIALLLGWPVVSSFLIGTRAGRVMVVAFAALMAAWYIFLSGKKSGGKRVEAEVKARKFKNAQKRIESDEQIRSMPRDELRREFGKWVR